MSQKIITYTLCITSSLKTLAQGPIDIHLYDHGQSLSQTTLKYEKEELNVNPAGAFAFTPGISLRTNGFGTNTQIHVRGAEQRHTAVYFDDVPLEDPSNYDGSALLDHLPLNDVFSNISLSKGMNAASSNNHGMGGALHFNTHFPKQGLHGSSTTTFGFFETFGENDQLSYGAQKWGAKVYNHFLNTRGEEDYKRNYRNRSGGGILFLKPCPRTKIKLFAHTINGRQNLDDRIFPYYVHTKAHLGVQGTKVQKTFGRRDHSFTCIAAHTHAKRDFIGPKEDLFKSESYFIAPSARFHTHEDTHDNVHIGGSFRTEKELITKRNQTISKGFFGLHQHISNVHINGYLYGENVKKTPLTFTLEGKYIPEENAYRPFIRVGTNTHRPSLWMLHDPRYGNKHLTPERSKNLEFGFDTNHKTIKPEILIFGRDVHHFLDYNPLTRRYENTQKAFIRGVEGRITLRPSDTFLIGFNYTHTYVKKSPQKMRSFIPRNSFNTLIKAKLHKKLTYTTKANVADRRQVSNPKNVPVPLLWDHHISYKPEKWFTLKASATNILNARFEDGYKILAPGRAFFGACTLRF